MKAKHIFKYTYEEGHENFSPVDVTFETPAEVTITQMLYNFECYLKACGFVFDGHLEVVDEEKYDESKVDDTDYCCMDDTDYIKTDCIGKEHTPNHEIEKNKWINHFFNPSSPEWKKS